MASFVIPSDRVASTQSNPLRDRPVLLQLLGERLLDAERLVARHGGCAREQGIKGERARSRLAPKGASGERRG